MSVTVQRSICPLVKYKPVQSVFDHSTETSQTTKAKWEWSTIGSDHFKAALKTIRVKSLVGEAHKHLAPHWEPVPWQRPRPLSRALNGDTPQHKALVLSLCPLLSFLEGLLFLCLGCYATGAEHSLESKQPNPKPPTRRRDWYGGSTVANTKEQTFHLCIFWTLQPQRVRLWMRSRSFTEEPERSGITWGAQLLRSRDVHTQIDSHRWL